MNDKTSPTWLNRTNGCRYTGGKKGTPVPTSYRVSARKPGKTSARIRV